MVRHDSRSPDRSHDRGKKHRRHSREREHDSPDRKSSRRERDHSRNERDDRDRRRDDSRRSERRRDSPHRDSRNSSSHRERESRRERSPPTRIKQEAASDDEQKPKPSAHLERLAREEDDRRAKQRRHRREEEDDAANFQYGLQVKGEKEDEPPVEKEKANFGLSGKLTEEKNVFNGIVVKYSEPPEARIPKRRWRFYVFKGEETLPTLYLHRQSAYLLGRDRKVADIPIDHPSCSKQHAALQFRLVNYERSDGTAGRTVRPYIIDLESANGTFVNNEKIEPKRYIELFEKDVVKFGFSSREYVLLHEESKAEASQDDMGVDA